MNKLVVILERALNVAEKKGDFVIEQAPQILQEFYMWHTFKHILGILVGVLCLFLARYLNNLWSDKYDGGTLCYGQVVLFGRVGEIFSMIMPFVIFSLMGVVFLSINIYNLIFISIAPKSYLIEYFVK